MTSQIISWIAVSFLFAATLSFLITEDWRWSLTFLALLYLGVFWLTQLHWTFSMAAVKLVTGWMVATILGITRSALDPNLVSVPESSSWSHGKLFRIFTAALAFFIALSTTPTIIKLLPGIGIPEVTGSLILMTMGLLLLGLTIRPLKVVIGLLAFIAGFEILYAAVENATLVAALLALVNLGLALVGAYLLTAGTDENIGPQE
ncbi:MAG: hypothetical protein HN392_02025 [Anaerolineae bacterium]|jgi:hypothetical protein|nr:hypothetical protein [Anaerolineae bacterium]MBT7073526.1 hypothetical protein [Anaerolineae bacterium]